MAELVLSKDYFISCLRNIAAVFEQQKLYLTQLDSDIGDGDHGINLSIGFREVSLQLPQLQNDTIDIGELLKKVGFILLSKVGGASGPLYGSFFIAMGKSAAGKSQVKFAEFCKMLTLGVESIEARGKAKQGDKTMLDALLPGIESLKTNAATMKPLEVIEKMVKVMQEGAESVVPLAAKKGRAMRLGERAIGHKDPGAESSVMLMQAFQEALHELVNK